MRRKRISKSVALWALVLVGIVLIAVQFLPVQKAEANPPVEAEIAVPGEVARILRDGCYDCHSHETEWPWYSQVAPPRWLVHHDVIEGREHLNFSTWGRYDEGEQAHRWEEIAEVLDEDAMPPWFYVPLHPHADLSSEDVATLRAWAVRHAGEGEESELTLR